MDDIFLFKDNNNYDVYPFQVDVFLEYINLPLSFLNRLQKLISFSLSLSILFQK